MQIRVLKPLKDYKEGTVITVDEKNHQEFTYWRRRLQDAKIDKCCEIVEEKAKKGKGKNEKPEAEVEIAIADEDKVTENVVQ